MSISDKHEAWWGGRIFSDTSKKSQDTTPKKGIVYYDSLISRLFMKQFSLQVTIEGKTYQVNRESAKKFLFENPHQKIDDSKIKEKLLQYYKDSIAQDDLTEEESSDPYQVGAILEGKELLEGIKAEKGVRTETLICKKLLEERLEKVGMKMGSAVDNGDCFYDAVAQTLSRILQRTITIKELRMVVKEELTKIDRADPKDNWVQKIVRDPVAYKELLEECEFTMEDRDEAPLWGTLEIAGEIIANHYKVAIILHEQQTGDTEVYTVDEYDSQEQEPIDGIVNIAQVFQDERGRLKVRTTPIVLAEVVAQTTTQYERSIEIAAYPGHFVPVSRP